MKKSFIIVLGIFLLNSLYSEMIENKYSKELECEEPMTSAAADYLKRAEEDIDLLKYKTIIRHGLIEEIEQPYLNDLQLGALTKTELKLFRNLFYAKKGYIFNDEELTKYFSQFDWYKPASKNITFTDRENSAINRIKLFESESTIQYEYEGKTITWEVWNGGADQRGPRLKLNQDKTFTYVPSESINRLKSITGTWTIKNNKIVLLAESEKILLGGFVAFHPNTPYIHKATPATINFQEPIEIILPLNESETYKKYHFSWSDTWLQIGSSDYYVSR